MVWLFYPSNDAGPSRVMPENKQALNITNQTEESQIIQILYYHGWNRLTHWPTASLTGYSLVPYNSSVEKEVLPIRRMRYIKPGWDPLNWHPVSLQANLAGARFIGRSDQPLLLEGRFFQGSAIILNWLRRQ